MFTASILPTAQIDCDERMLFWHGDILKRRRINCFAYLLQDAEHKILIDTGVWDLDAVNRTKKGADRWRLEGDDQNILAHLRARGIHPDEIEELILTHGHYDHAGAAWLFQHARVYLQAKEWNVIFSPENPMRGELGALRDYLMQSQAEGRVHLLTGDGATQCGVQLMASPGHTLGSQMALAETPRGRALFTGDAVFMLANLEENLPIGFSVDEEGSARALEYCRQFDGLILTGHDPRCAEMLGRGENV